jgi:hypothetical protein
VKLHIPGSTIAFVLRYSSHRVPIVFSKIMKDREVDPKPSLLLKVGVVLLLT